MGDHGFAYIVDLDEFIVPQQPLAALTTPAFIAKIEEFKRPPKEKSTDAFLFKNTFFCRYLFPVFNDTLFSVSSTTAPTMRTTLMCSL